MLPNNFQGPGAEVIAAFVAVLFALGIGGLLLFTL